MKAADYIMRLTPRQQSWVKAYVDCGGNNAEACRQMGIGPTSSYLHDEKCKAAVAAVYREAAELVAPKVATTKEWLLDRLRTKADADLADLFDDHGELLPVKQWPEVWRKGLVASVEVINDVSKVKIADRIKILELLGKHVDVGAFSEKLNVEISEDLADVFARRRAAAGGSRDE
jgi:phage terminase small subunit